MTLPRREKARTSALAALLALVLALLLAGGIANPAEAREDKSFELPRAHVVANVRPDGSVFVTEEITYDFSGSFEGGYREIPLKGGMSVSDVSVSENDKRYGPGASTRLGSSGAPGTYGGADIGYAYMIVWHYRATDEQRTFTIRYRVEDLAVAHDDVVDVYWQAWGDEWQESLGSLQATMNLPGDPKRGEVKVFGHPAWVSGKTSLGPDKASPRLVASDVPPEQFVEMRVVFPRELLSSTGGARVASGEGLKKIMDEEAADARSESRQAWLMRLRTLFGPLLVALSAGMMAFVYLRYGREPKVDYEGRYEREPPTDDPPAVIGAIISQKPSVGTREFTATLFDLIRRGVLSAQPVSVKKDGLWGDKTMTDFRVDLGSYERGSLEGFEGRVLNVAHRVLSHGPVNLTDFEERMKDVGKFTRQDNRSSYEAFRDELKWEVARRDLVEQGLGIWLGWAALMLGLAGIEWFVLSLLGAGLGTLIFLVCISPFAFYIAGWVLLRVFGNAGTVLGSVLHPLWVRRTPKGALLRARWQAFRRYLTDFSRMEEAPPASLALWERFLVYGIALGVAEEVLEAARLYAPPEVAQGGNFYIPGHDGYVSGPAGLSLSSLEKGFSDAFSAPSPSGSWSGGGKGSFSGGGGSFSGDGGSFSGGGGGGGGGGAW